MVGNDTLKSIIQSYKHETIHPEVLRNGKISKQGNSKVIKSKSKCTSNTYKDLAPSLSNNLTILFIGYNPGIESSLKQHHYAHFTNLFWKLFNQSKLLLQVLEVNNYDLAKYLNSEDLLSKLVTEDQYGELCTNVLPEHDFELVKYNIGFTDLVLRCTRSAEELSLSEKLSNVPRLLEEFKNSSLKYLVFVGKGIWEIVVTYFCKSLGIKKLKLTKTNFIWGIQTKSMDEHYNEVLKELHQTVGHYFTIYVFPNTSGLVTTLKYSEKLKLWTDLSNDILNCNRN
ncbi:uncharacterized protein PRCAT00001867001 [Priceomyces carsonii]|uniref:uncharacterized protein n=1 Tax=Priceomyces carsonii TaxID=28549 RepID=UPI002ED9EA07|nr:unnamed protein product [Priceomyces carsonii]